MKKKERSITIRTAVKRLTTITLSELRKLSNRELNNIQKLHNLMGPVEQEIVSRDAVKDSLYLGGAQTSHV